MIEPKAKKCKGTGKAKGFGCGKTTLYRKYGLCKDECYPDWLLNSINGRKVLEKATLTGKKKAEKAKARKHREQKRKIKTLSMLKAELQKEVNTIVRLIDEDKTCISCNHGIDGFTRQAHAGHFKSVGSNDSLRFHLDNNHKQCSICNNHLSGNVLEYKKGLTERYGNDYAELVDVELQKKYPVMKFSRPELEEAITTSRAIIRKIKKGKDFTRKQVNEILKLYN